MIRFLMRVTSIAAIIAVITSHLLRPRHRSTLSEKKCQTVILHRVIEKLPCDPRFTSTYSMFANRLNVVVTLMLAVAFLAAETGNAQADGYPQFASKRPSSTAPQKYCGKKLSNALQIICDGVYNSMFKKSGQARIEGNTGRTDRLLNSAGAEEMEMADYPFAYSAFPFMSSTKAREILGRYNGRRRRESRGIHEECCLNACTINELSSYCGSL